VWGEERKYPGCGLEDDMLETDKPRQAADHGTTVSTSILAIEDVPANLALLHAILEPAGFVVSDAMTLQEARRSLERARPQLILLDVRLPDGDGLDLAREIQAWPNGERIPILAISASVLPHEQADALAAGCSGFLAKPIRPTQLLTSVRGILEQPTA